MSSKSAYSEHDSRIEYNKVRNAVKRRMRQAKRLYECGISTNAKTNPKAVWAYVRQKMNTKTGVAPLLSDRKDVNSTKFDDKDKADIVQGEFASVFTREPGGDIPETGRRSRTTIKKKLNVDKSVGPDEIHPRLSIQLCIDSYIYATLSLRHSLF